MANQFLAMACLIWVEAQNHPRKVDDRLTAIANAYRANRDSNTNATFEFSISTGNAASINEFRQKEPASIIRGRGRLLILPNHGLFEISYNDETLDKTTKAGPNGKVYGRVLPQRILRNGKLTFTDFLLKKPGSTTFLHMVRLSAGTAEYDRNLVFPLDLSAASPSFDFCRDTERALAGIEGWGVGSSTETVQAGEGSVEKIGFTTLFGKREYLIDLARGAVPIRIADSDKKNKEGVVITQDELKQSPNGNWMPHRRIFQAGRSIKIVEINSASWRAPSPSEFLVYWGEPKTIVNEQSGAVYLALKSINLDQLPAHKLVVKTAPERTRVPSEPTSLREPPSHWPQFIISALLACIGAFVLWSRKRRN